MITVYKTTKAVFKEEGYRETSFTFDFVSISRILQERAIVFVILKQSKDTFSRCNFLGSYSGV